MTPVSEVTKSADLRQRAVHAHRVREARDEHYEHQAEADRAARRAELERRASCRVRDVTGAAAERITVTGGEGRAVEIEADGLAFTITSHPSGYLHVALVLGCARPGCGEPVTHYVSSLESIGAAITTRGECERHEQHYRAEAGQ